MTVRSVTRATGMVETLLMFAAVCGSFVTRSTTNNRFFLDAIALAVFASLLEGVR